MAIFNIKEQNLYLKSKKKLSKKFKNISYDIDNFLNNIQTKDDLGIELKSNVYKVRISNTNKHKGKSAGYRLISYLKVIDNELHLLYIYDKSSIENLTEKEIDTIILKQI